MKHKKSQKVPKFSYVNVVTIIHHVEDNMIDIWQPINTKTGQMKQI